MTKNNPVQILSIDAKDIYGVNSIGKDYTVKYRDGQINFKKYINTLDDSLDLRKLREIYYKVYRKSGFGFFDKNKKHWQATREYSNQVVNVTFNYSHKLYNKVNKHTYVRSGYCINDLELTDCICIVGGELLAIKVGHAILENQLDGIETKYFRFNEEQGVYEQFGNIKVLESARTLREYLYKNGFTLDGIKYVRYKRSSGSARVGKCLFINEELFARIRKWDLCGLRIRDGQDIDLAAFEAAISLSLSSIIDTVDISPENILIIREDYEDEFEDNVVAVTLKENGLHSEPQRVKVKNNIWDGQSLLDKSVFGTKYLGCGMLLLRNRFFKTCGFNTDIQKWFADNNITCISQLNGFTLATDISQIKMITTPSSIKYLKFGDKSRWLHSIDKGFGVVKHDKPTYFFDGRMVQTHYQLLNTLQMSYEDVENFLQPSLDYISQIRTDPAVLRYHIRYPYNDLEDLEYRSKNDIVFGLMGLNEKFTNTRLYHDFKKDLVKSLIKNLRKGHVLVNGTYATMFGNGLEMLKESIGHFYGKSEIGIGYMYSKRFGDGVTVLGTRSPHINSGNVYVAKNIHISEFDKYFNLTNEIVCVNAIGENIQQRLNGADYDSDTMLITGHPLLIERAKQNYDNFLVPTSLIGDEKTKRCYTSDHQVDLDVKTSINRIGEVVNLSQELNSMLWHNISQKQNPQTVEQNLSLYYDICKLAVLSGIEIDRAKKEFMVDSRREIELLKFKYRLEDNDGRIIRPKFFKMITLENGYSINPNIKYIYRNTPMDLLQKVVWKYRFATRGSKNTIYMPLHSIVRTIGENRIYGKHRRHRDSIVSELRRWAAELRNVFSNKGLPSDRKSKFLWLRLLRDEYISNVKLGKRTAYLLLKTLEDKEFRDVSMIIFQILFNYQNSVMLEVLNDNKDVVEMLEEHEFGNILLYGLRFRKVKIE